MTNLYFKPFRSILISGMTCLASSLNSLAQYSACAINIGQGGPVPGDGLPHCFNLMVTGFPSSLPPYGTTGQCCLEGIGVSISSFCSGDIKITATSPAGTTLLLADQRGGSIVNAYGSVGSGNCNGGGTTFSSNGNGNLNGLAPFITCAAGIGPYFIPDDNSPAGTNIFAGENINGIWSICITVNNPSSCGGINNTVNVSSVGIFGNAASTTSASLVPVISGNTVLCKGNNTTLSANAPNAVSYSWTPFSGLNNSTGIQVSCNVMTSTIYTVTATDASGNTGTSTVLITVNDPPQVNTLSYQASCGNNNGSATAIATGNNGPFSYSWSTTPSVTTQTVTGLPPGSYSVIVTDIAGCSSTATVNIVNLSGATVAINAVTPASCNGAANGSASAIISGGLAPYNFSWNTTPVQNSPVATNLGAGSYVLVVTDANGCSSTDTAVIIQPPPISANISAVSSYCNNPTGMANISASGGTGTFSYLWNTIPAQTTATATALAQGVYSCLISDVNGCTTSAMVSINNFPSGQVSISAVIQPACYGFSNGSATAIISGGAPPYAYQWNTIPQQTTQTAANLNAGNYTVTITDAAGCTATQLAVVGQPDQLICLVNDFNTDCNSSNGQAVINISGGVLPYNYVWNTQPAQFLATATGLAAGIYSCQVTDGNNCSASATVQINNKPGATVSIAAQHNLSCNGDSSGSISISLSGGTPPFSYFWNTNPIQTDTLAQHLSAGNYIVTVTDAVGCTGTAMGTVVQPPELVTVSNSTNNYCGTVTALAIVNAMGGMPPYSYSWSTIPVQTTNLVSGLLSGVYSCTVTDAYGCKQVENFTVSDLPLGTATIIVSKPVKCNGDHDGSLTAHVNGGSPPYHYLWNTQPAATNGTISQLASGAYQVQVTDANGCTLTAQAFLTEPASIIVNSSSAPSVCSEKNGLISLTVDGGVPPFQYIWNTSPPQNSNTATGLAAGNYNCFITDANNCTSSYNYELPGSVKPTAQFSWTPEILSMQNPSCSFINESLNGDNWIWDFNDPDKPGISKLKNPMHTFSDTGKYCVQLIAGNFAGCADTITRCIDVSLAFSVYIPTAFTPNSDGLNDFFMPQMFGVDTRNYLFEIYNKWGTLVFRTTDQHINWDGSGKKSGYKMQEDIYIWKLSLQEEGSGISHHLKGQVILAR